jgi:hypothetical protein
MNLDIFELEKYSLKKVHETWDYAVSKQIVYGPKTAEKEVSLTWPFIVKNYIEIKRWFEIFICSVWYGNFQDYIAVIASTQFSRCPQRARPLIVEPILKTCAHVHCDDSEMSMLFDCPECMQSPQGVLFRYIPSMIWLQSLDNLSCLGWNISRHLLENTGITPTENGETSFVGRTNRIQEGKLPSQVFQRRPQTVNGIACQQTHFNREGLRRLVPIDVNKILPIEFGRNQLRIVPQIGAHELVESFKVFPRSFNFELGTIQRMHILTL